MCPPPSPATRALGHTRHIPRVIDALQPARTGVLRTPPSRTRTRIVRASRLGARRPPRQGHQRADPAGRGHPPTPRAAGSPEAGAVEALKLGDKSRERWMSAGWVDSDANVAPHTHPVPRAPGRTRVSRGSLGDAYGSQSVPTLRGEASGRREAAKDRPPREKELQEGDQTRLGARAEKASRLWRGGRGSRGALASVSERARAGEGRAGLLAPRGRLDLGGLGPTRRPTLEPRGSPVL